MFTVGALSNGTRAILMRLSGQRIVAQLRNDTYASALKLVHIGSVPPLPKFPSASANLIPFVLKARY